MCLVTYPGKTEKDVSKWGLNPPPEDGALLTELCIDWLKQRILHYQNIDLFNPLYRWCIF